MKVVEDNEIYPITKTPLNQTRAIFQTLLLEYPVSKAIRDRLASFFGSLEIVQNRLENRISTLNINYRCCVAVEEDLELRLSSSHPSRKSSNFDTGMNFVMLLRLAIAPNDQFHLTFKTIALGRVVPPTLNYLLCRKHLSIQK
ncbi:MAG: hypothetical protein AAGF83_17830 [Cyanobacteria bacterium P01_G01_bin.67]